MDFLCSNFLSHGLIHDPVAFNNLVSIIFNNRNISPETKLNQEQFLTLFGLNPTHPHLDLEVSNLLDLEKNNSIFKSLKDPS
jgi:hypothetical protein